MAALITIQGGVHLVLGNWFSFHAATWLLSQFPGAAIATAFNSACVCLCETVPENPSHHVPGGGVAEVHCLLCNFPLNSSWNGESQQQLSGESQTWPYCHVYHAHSTKGVR